MNRSFGARVADRCKTASPGKTLLMSSASEMVQSVEVFWVAVEGVIGVGKSTLMSILMPRLRKVCCFFFSPSLRSIVPQQEFGDNRVYEVPENVEELMKSNLFQKYCRKPKKYAYEFQTMFFDARTEDFLEQWAHIESDVAETTSPFDRRDPLTSVVHKRIVILSERSILSDSIFMRVQFECGHVNHRQLANYNKLNSRWRGMYPIEPGLVIYCQAGPTVDAAITLCQQRIVERGRDGEEVLVTPKYNTMVLQEHDRVFGGGTKVARFHMGNDLKGFFSVPVVVFDTTENYRDDAAVELKKSAEVLAHIREVLHQST
jgi:deoxyadenosine/deoxycytidine kinase